jgi:hypothetical protein
VGDERLSQSELPRAADSPKPVRIMLPQTGVSQREGTLKVGHTDEHDNKSKANPEVTLQGRVNF